MKAAAVVLAALLAAPAQTPAALAVDATCANYATTHTLVRNDVLAKMDAADRNLPKAEAALKQAQADLQAMTTAAEELQKQKDLLQEHIKLLEKVIQAQPAPQTTPDAVAAAIEGAWEWADAPIAFVAGTGMCVGVAWGLNQATR